MAGPQQGGTSYILLADQTNRGELAAWGNYRKWLYGFISGGVGVAADFANFEANNGSYAASKPIMGQEGSEGNFVIPHDSEGVGFWLKHAMRKAPDTTELKLNLVSSYQNPKDLLAAGDVFTLSSAGKSHDVPATQTQKNKQPCRVWPAQVATGKMIPAGVNVMRMQLKVTTAVNLSTDKVIVTVHGKDQIGTAIQEKVTLTGSISSNDLFPSTISDTWWSEIDKVTVDDSIGSHSIVVNIQLDPGGLYMHEFSAIGEDLLAGMSAEFVKGQTPELFRDLHVNQFGYTIGDTNQISIGLTGGAAFPETNAQDGGTDPSDLTGKERQPGRNASGWGTIIRVDDMILKCGEASLDVNYNLGADENSYCRDRYRPAPVINAKRSVVASARVSYPAQICHYDPCHGPPVADTEWGIADMMAKVRCGEFEVAIEAALVDQCGDANNFIIMKLPTAKFNEVPDPRDLSAAQINNPLSFAAFKKGNLNDLETTVVNTEDATAFVA